MEQDKLDKPYSENWFEVEVKIYDDFDIKQAIEEEEMKKENIPFSYTTGSLSLPVSEIIGFSDYYRKGRSLEEVSERGFDCTLIYTKTLGTIECTWGLKKLKSKLNEFVTAYPKAPEFLAEVK